jgi:hypothetical protein
MAPKTLWGLLNNDDEYVTEFMDMVRSRHFAKSCLLNDTLIPDTYQLFARVYEHGDVEAYAPILHTLSHQPHNDFILEPYNSNSAKVALLASMTESEQSRSAMCHLGLKCGMYIFIVIL